MSASASLGAPVTDGGIRSVNFFNGRLLTGQDLTLEQQAQLAGRSRIVRAVGTGVAAGLEAGLLATSSTDERPVLRISAGLALAPDGTALELPVTADVALTRSAPSGSAAEAVFHDCAPLQPTTYTAGAGVYLLAVGPAAAGEGRAAAGGLGDGGGACLTAYTREGVAFSLLRLALPAQLAADPARLRNRLAHELLGTTDPGRARFAAAPLDPPPARYGLLDELRAIGCLGPGQVPLATLAWTSGGGVGFVDAWSVRRRIVAPAAAARLPELVGDRRVAECEAAVLQFQDEVADAMRPPAALGAVAAPDRFAFLPPAGLLPVLGDGSPAGFDADVFFGAPDDHDVAEIDGRRLRELFHDARFHDPIPTAASTPVRRYAIRENDLAVAAGTTHQRVIAFAHPDLGDRAVARFGRARFGRGRVAPPAPWPEKED